MLARIGRLADYSRLERTIFDRPAVGLSTVVVGAGALGNEVVKTLGMLGIRSILVIDPDRVEATDLPRSVFFRETNCLGRNKAVAMVEIAQSWFPDTRFAAIQSEIADVGYGDLAGAALIFSCVDSDLARLEIAYAALATGIPVCDAGLGTPNYSHGRVSWFPGVDAACFGCKLTPRKRRELLTFWDATVRPCGDIGTHEAAPSTPTMAAITGSLQVELGLRWLAQRESESMTFEISLDGEPRSSMFRTPRSSSCPLHEPAAARHALPHPDATFDELFLAAPGSSGILLDWPITMRVRCQNCRCEWAPMRRAAVVRRSSTCPSCGSARILELKTVRKVERGSVWSDMRPALLGLPENHRYAMYFERSAG